MVDTGAMSDADPETTSHADVSDGHDADHGHQSAGDPLGPVDTATWGYAIAGGAIGIFVAVVLFVAGAD